MGHFYPSHPLVVMTKAPPTDCRIRQILVKKYDVFRFGALKIRELYVNSNLIRVRQL